MFARFCCCLLVATVLSASEAPLGSKDFYPSPEHPVGFRGDGNGWFPDATPVAEWWDGTPKQEDRTYQDRDKEKTAKAWVLADRTAKNIAWKTEMPGWVNGQPIVVGDKVFTYGEPDLLICCDTNTGAILWTQAVNPWECAGADPAKARTARELYLVYLAIDLVLGVQFHFGTCGRYLAPTKYAVMLDVFEKEELPGILTALTKLDPQGGWDAAAKTMLQGVGIWRADPTADSKKCWGYEKNRDVNALKGQLKKRIEAISGVQGMPLGMPWGNMVGWLMSTPISDGEHVYVQMGQGQTACFTLDGKRVWQTFFAQKNVSTHHVLDPLLADGILVDMHGSDMLRGLDAKTGKQVWEAPTAKPQKSAKGGYYVASHKIFDLDGLKVIVTSQCAIIRARDGKHVGSYDFGDKYGGGAPIAGCGRLFIKCGCGDGWGQAFAGYELVKESDDAVTAKQLWTEPGKGSAGYESRVVTPTATWLCGRDVTALDPRSGKQLCKAPIDGKFRLIAGTVLISRPGGSGGALQGGWSNRRWDDVSLIPFTTTDITDPSAPKTLSQQNLIVVDTNPLLAGVEKYLPKLWADPDFYNAKGGKPGQAIHTDTAIFPSGNRLFLRSLTHLYAIGDPGRPYDWNPKSRP